MSFYSLYNGYLSTLPALIMGLITYRYLSGGIKWLFWFVVFGTLMQWSGKVLVFMGYYNVALMHLYVPGKFILFTMVYVYFLKTFIPSKWLYSIAVAFVLFSIVNTLFIQSLMQYNSNVRALGSLLLSVYAVLYFMRVLHDMKMEKLKKEPTIWINTGALLYFSGSFFVFILSNLILDHSWRLSAITWRISGILMSLFYILIGIGFWKAKALLRSGYRPSVS